MHKIVVSLFTTFLVVVLSAGLAQDEPVRVAMVTSESGLGDRSFNDMMLEGMKKAETDFGIEYSTIQPRSISEFKSLSENL